MFKLKTTLIFAFILFLSLGSIQAQDNFSTRLKPMTLEDIMKFKALRGASISDNGQWIGYYAKPDRGNNTAYIQSTSDSTVYTVERGSKPSITANGKWAATLVSDDIIKIENAKPGKAPKKELALINLSNGTRREFKEVKSFNFSNDSKWLVYQKDQKNKPEGKNKKRPVGDDIILRHLDYEAEITLDNVTEYAFDSTANYFAYVQATPDAKDNKLAYINLSSTFTMPMTIEEGEKNHYSELTWKNDTDVLTYISAIEGKDGKPDSCQIMTWNSMFKDTTVMVGFSKIPEGWYIPFKNKIQWTEDYDRFFFGFRPLSDTLIRDEEFEYTDSNYYNIDTIMKRADLDMWHWNDPKIKTQEKKEWKREQSHLFKAIFNTELNNVVQLSDEKLPDIVPHDNPKYCLGYDDTPYKKLVTWEGWFHDIYIIDLRDGSRKLLAEKAIERAHLSPLGRYVAYFRDKNWYIYDIAQAKTQQINEKIPQKFYNEDLDEPTEPGSYGLAGWTFDDRGVLIYDKYDIWLYYTNGNSMINQTNAEGRIRNKTYRIKNLDPRKRYFEKTDNIILTAYDHNTKTRGISKLNLRLLGPETIIRDDKLITIYFKAKNSSEIIISKQKYDMFPDMWVTDSTFKNMKQLTDVNPEMSGWYWGKSELMKFQNALGDTIEGFLVKPENFDSTKKYPLMVYFYDKFSDYTNRFFLPAINHRPCFQYYTGQGYLIFLPDIHYVDGRPGFSAVDCMVPGIRKLINQGIVDSTAIALQGHSWGAYQTAFIITQTDLFAAAIAGAPVGNMTSAYSGIRLGSGLARQFQYEHFQSRIGGNLWDSLDNYLNNSPIFQAEKANTPLMIMHGDIDDAVPWEQSIELYLAFRRLGKECIFLQYRNEPHHPKRYQNKLDYTIKMMEYYDHYVLKKPAADWINNGIKYQGK